MKEYKVLSQTDNFFGGKFDQEKLEGALNAYAKQGWCVITTASAEFRSFAGNREQLFIILEREITEQSANKKVEDTTGQEY